MGVFENIYNAGSDVFGYDSTADNAREEQLAKAKQVAQQQQSQLASENRGLEVGQYDSPAISQCVNWGGFSHADIYKTNQESIDQGSVGDSAQTWIKLANKLRERGEKYSKEIGDIVRGGWQGEAADKAAEVGKPASEWMVRSADAFEATGNNLNAAGDAAGKSKQMVPQPEGYSLSGAAAMAIPMGVGVVGVDALGQMEAQEEAQKAAQGTMGRVYSPTLSQVDGQMPQYTKPDGNTAQPPPVPPQGGGPGGSGMPSGSGGSGAGGAGSGQGIGAVGSGGVGGGIPGGGPSPSQTSSASAAAPPGVGMPGAGAGAGMPGGGAVGGMGMAGLGAGGAGGARGLGAGGARGAGMGAGGRAGAGGLGSGAGAGAGAGAAGRGGAGGRGMMGGAGAGAGRGQGEGDDDEHERPSWLEEQDDVWMNDMPKTAPPVLGE